MYPISLFRKETIVKNAITFIFFGKNNWINILYAQMQFESADFKSNAFLKHKNALGMTKPTVRPTTFSETWSGEYGNNTGASYSSYFDMVYDMKLYIEQFKDYKTYTYNVGSLPYDLGVYTMWLFENGYYTASPVAYELGVGSYYNKRKSSVLNYVYILVSLGVSLTVLFYVIRAIRKRKIQSKNKK
jgi:hypothetical protein